jgi:hypothetical protein
MSEIPPLRGKDGGAGDGSEPSPEFWGGYIALAVLSTGIMFAGVMVSRALGEDPRADDEIHRFG